MCEKMEDFFGQAVPAQSFYRGFLAAVGAVIISKWPAAIETVGHKVVLVEQLYENCAFPDGTMRLLVLFNVPYNRNLSMLEYTPGLV